MKSYEYKTLQFKQGLMSMKLNEDREGLIAALNNEGRAGWRGANQPPFLVNLPFTVLLEREV